jgi:ArsR family transcriptional regulator
MKLVHIYQCLCDQTRLRILNLLGEGELCVCHFQKILGEPQVKISKHLAYLRSRGLVETRRDKNWMIYRLPLRPSAELSVNLACLQDCVREDPVFRADSARLRKCGAKLRENSPICCPPAQSARSLP